MDERPYHDDYYRNSNRWTHGLSFLSGMFVGILVLSVLMFLNTTI